MAMSAIVEGTELVSRRPVAELQPYLGCFWALVHEPGTSVQTIPDASTYLVIELSERAAPRCLIAGPRLKSMRSAPATRRTDILGVRLRPGVAFLLTGTSIDQLVGRREPLAAFLGDRADQLAASIAEAKSNSARFDVLESFLLERLPARQLDARVELTLRLMERSAGGAAVSKVAKQCGVSCRQLERVLRVWVGVTPKRLARIARFQSVLARAGKAPALEWTHVAAEQNYADQAHMIHEFSG